MIVGVEFTATELIVSLDDGRHIATPLDWYPRLKSATPEQRAAFELSRAGVHWPGIDEDLSLAGMLAGNRAVRQ